MEIKAHRVTKTFGIGASAVRAVAEVTVRIESGELFFSAGPQRLRQDDPTAGYGWAD